MTWIRTIPFSEADEELRQAMEGQKSLYPQEYAVPIHPAEGGGSLIVASHSLIPQALHHAFSTYGALLSPDLPLQRRHHEMIAPMTPQERVMIDYVVKLTKDATKVWKDDHEKLRAAGFEDQAILQITLIASWFNYINRVADALGVGREP